MTQLHKFFACVGVPVIPGPTIIKIGLECMPPGMEDMQELEEEVEDIKQEVEDENPEAQDLIQDIEHDIRADFFETMAILNRLKGEQENATDLEEESITNETAVAVANPRDPVLTIWRYFGFTTSAAPTIEFVGFPKWKRAIDKFLVDLGVSFLRYFEDIPVDFDYDEPHVRYKRSNDRMVYNDNSWVHLHGRAAGIILVTIAFCIFLGMGYLLIHMGCCGCFTICDLISKCGEARAAHRRPPARRRRRSEDSANYTEMTDIPHESASEDEEPPPANSSGGRKSKDLDLEAAKSAAKEAKKIVKSRNGQKYA